MAHECPECFSACYCGGDIDDCLFEDTPEEHACTCCLGKEEDDDPDTYEESDDDDPYEDRL